MARELKFRVWDNVDYMSSPFTLQDVQSGKIKFTTDCQIMQFTGLLDKNGKEIYEGDMCLIFTDEPTEVVFENGAFGYLDSSGYFISFAQNMWFFWDSNSQTKEIEVIGNIYQNPELLKC
jgi:hypothetical protein